jgi:hypothetical protein
MYESIEQLTGKPKGNYKALVLAPNKLIKEFKSDTLVYDIDKFTNRVSKNMFVFEVAPLEGQEESHLILVDFFKNINGE